MERKQEHDFDNKWIEERTNGFWKYYVKHLGGVVMIMFGIFVASCIAKKGNKCNLFTCFNGGCRDISVFSMGN